jgi:hypothetical protein
MGVASDARQSGSCLIANHRRRLRRPRGAFVPQKCANCPGELSVARMCTQSEVLPMSEVIPLPPKPANPPSKSIQEETAEFLAQLQRIRSQAQKSK